MSSVFLDKVDSTVLERLILAAARSDSRVWERLDMPERPVPDFAISLETRAFMPTLTLLEVKVVPASPSDLDEAWDADCDEA